MQRRVTKQKLAIQKTLSRADNHLTAAEVYKRVRRKIKNISLATVYRNLEQMTDDGILESVYVAGCPKWYELKKEQCHGHLYCRNCGCLVEVMDCELCGMKTKIGKEIGFIEDQMRFVAVGLCKKCIKKKNGTK